METRYTLELCFGIEITLHPLLLLYFVISAALPWLLNSSTMTMKVWLYYSRREHSFVVWYRFYCTNWGHCFATRKVGGEVHGILLWPLGGLAYIGHSGDAKDDLIVSIAGPLTHIPQALLWYGLSQAFTRGTFYGHVVRSSLMAQYLVDAFQSLHSLLSFRWR